MASNKSGIGVLGLLGVAFVVLKLCHVIDWSWWWVTAPFWGGIALVIIAVVIVAIIRTRQDNTPITKTSRWQQRLEELKAEQDRKRTIK